MHFSALVLAGGRSTRMGRDKARLIVSGQTLLQRQTGLLRSLGVEQVFLSCRPGEYQPGPGITLLSDNFPGKGPLAGVERGLQAIGQGLLLVLAVDMPAIDEPILRRLMASCSKTRGIVPLIEGRPDPLAAVYPKISHALALQHLREERLAMSEFVAACYVSGLVGFHPVSQEDRSLFANWNTPSDLPPS